MSTENATPATEVKAKKVKAPKEVKPKIQITPEQIRTDLLNGLNRDEIAEKYGAPRTVINRFFKHPSLKGLRPKHKSQFELVVDGEAVPVNAIPVEKTVKPVTEVFEAQVAPEAEQATVSGSIADRVTEETGI